jgi:DNA polymerase-3 subunit delta
MEIAHGSLTDVLQKAEGTARPVWLIHGQEVLVEKACEEVIGFILGKDDRDVSCHTIDGFAQNVPDLLAELNTFSMLAATKVAVFKDAKLFDTKAGHQGVLLQIGQALGNHQMDKAAKSLLSLCGRLGLDVSKVPTQYEDYPDLHALYKELGKAAVGQMVDYCATKGWDSVSADNHIEILHKAIQTGFPQGHHLIITVSSKVPKNLKIYKTINEDGAIVDCNVPLGERRMDKEAQQAVMRQTAEAMLKKAGKHLAPGLYGSLMELTGFDLRTFDQNLEKLISYVGERKEITSDDISALLKRTKTDPLFQLTNAVADRNLQQALFFAQSLLGHQWHALQLLAAIANQIRKLLIAKDFAASSFGQQWTAGLSYGQFQQSIIPAIQGYDENASTQIVLWPEKTKAKPSKGQKKIATDLRLAPNPKNAYPVYQTMLKSEKYTLTELRLAIRHLNQADIRLKSTGQDHYTVIKKVIIDICGRMA